MQHWFPPAEHKQTAEWLVGPHSLEELIGFCVSKEAAGRSSNGHCLMMIFFVIWEGQLRSPTSISDVTQEEMTFGNG